MLTDYYAHRAFENPNVIESEDAEFDLQAEIDAMGAEDWEPI